MALLRKTVSVLRYSDRLFCPPLRDKTAARRRWPRNYGPAGSRWQQFPATVNLLLVVADGAADGRSRSYIRNHPSACLVRSRISMLDRFYITRRRSHHGGGNLPLGRGRSKQRRRDRLLRYGRCHGADKNVDGVTGENSNAGTLTDCCWSNSLETGIGDGTKPESCPQPAP